MAAFPFNRMAPYPVHGIGLTHPSYELMNPMSTAVGKYLYNNDFTYISFNLSLKISLSYSGIIIQSR